MTAKIIEWRKNELGFPHVVCSACSYNDTFYIKTSYDENDVPVFYSIICTACGNEIFCNLQAVFPPTT